MMEQNKEIVKGNLPAPTSMTENVVSAVFLRFGPRCRSWFPMALFVRSINEAGLLQISATQLFSFPNLSDCHSFYHIC